MIGGAHLPHQVKAQREAVTANIDAGLEFLLAILTQLVHDWTSWKGAITSVERDLPITP